MKRELVLVLSIIFILVLGACGPADTATTVPTGQGEQVTTLTEEPEPSEEVDEPEGDEISILRVGSAHGPDCLNPFGCSDHWDFNNLAYEGFTGIGPNCDTLPRLAKSWEVSEDGLTWTLELQEGARFTDFLNWFNSSELTTWYYASWNMTEVEVLDDYTLQFTTEVPIGNYPTWDATWWWIMQPYEWSNVKGAELYTYPELPNGTGPYDITEWVPGEYVIFDAKPDYYLGKPAIDRIVFQQFANWDAVVLALTAGEIDMVHMALPVQYFNTLDTDPAITIEERPPGWIRTLYFNMSEFGNKHPAISDPQVRKAIDYAIDRESALNIALEGHGMLCPNNYACGPLYEGEINPELSVTPFDLNLANQILEDAGYLDTDNDGVRESPEGEALEFRLFVEDNQPPDLVIAEQITETLEEIGISTQVETLESGTLFTTMLSERDYDLVVQRYWPDIDPGAFDFYQSCWSAEAGSSALNWTGYCNPQVDDLVYLYYTTADREEAMGYIYEAQSIFNNDRPQLSIVGDFLIEAFRTDRFDFPIPGESCDMTPGHWNWPLILEAKPK
jgi:peptide/nickel transport system substrate-binding protein